MREHSVHIGEVSYSGGVTNVFPGSSGLRVVHFLAGQLNVVVMGLFFPIGVGSTGGGLQLYNSGGEVGSRITSLPFSWPEGYDFDITNASGTTLYDTATVPTPPATGYSVCVVYSPVSYGVYNHLWKELTPFASAPSPVTVAICNWASQRVRFVIRQDGVDLYDNDVAADTVTWIDLSSYVTDPDTTDVLLIIAYIDDPDDDPDEGYVLPILGSNFDWMPKCPYAFVAVDHYDTAGVTAYFTAIPWDRQIARIT